MQKSKNFKEMVITRKELQMEVKNSILDNNFLICKLSSQLSIPIAFNDSKKTSKKICMNKIFSFFSAQACTHICLTL